MIAVALKITNKGEEEDEYYYKEIQPVTNEEKSSSGEGERGGNSKCH